MCLGSRQQGLADALATVAGQHSNVMDVHQRARFEGGVAFHAVDQSYRLVVQPGDKAGHTGAIGQVVAQARLHIVGEWRATTHWVAGVGVEQHQQCIAVVGVGEVNG